MGVAEQIQSDEDERRVKLKAQRDSMPYVDARAAHIPMDLLMRFNKEMSERYQMVPIQLLGQVLRVGVRMPLKTDNAASEIEKILGVRIQPYLISEAGYQNIVNQYSKLPARPTGRPTTTREKALVLATPKIKSISDIIAMVSQKDTQVAVGGLLAASIFTGATDIHLDPDGREVQLRFRVDGVLHELGSLEKKLYEQLLSRIKFYSNLKLNVPTPQDGRIQARYEDSEVDFRVGTMPSIHGESVAIRVLKTEAKMLRLEDLGFTDYDLKVVQKHIERPKGMILATGPTGSGKTTTMYSILNILNRPDVNIITLEDPVEYLLPGVTQSPINEKEKYGFAVALRASLRHDPDVIMVGEIRDAETAEIAFRAALTGHITLSTYHAGEAVSAIPSMIEMGVRPYLASSALNIVIAQRLVRRICKFCKKETTYSKSTTKEITEKINKLPAEAKPTELKIKFYKGAGCKECRGLGYMGQIGIHEVLEISPEIIRLSTENAPLMEIQAKAQEEGMVSMESDGFLKAIQGITTIEEVWRVIGTE